MEGLKDFKDMLARLECRNRRWRIGLVCAEDESSRMAVEWALQRKFVNVVFIGGTEIVLADKRFDRYRSHISVVRAESRDEAACTAVRMAREGTVDILMKGLINTDNLLRAVLNKEHAVQGSRYDSCGPGQNAVIPQDAVLHRLCCHTISQQGTKGGAGADHREDMQADGHQQAESSTRPLHGESERKDIPAYGGLRGGNQNGQRRCFWRLRGRRANGREERMLGRRHEDKEHKVTHQWRC